MRLAIILLLCLAPTAAPRHPERVTPTGYRLSFRCDRDGRAGGGRSDSPCSRWRRAPYAGHPGTARQGMTSRGRFAISPGAGA